MKKLDIKKWALTAHAVERMEERKVSMDEVRAIITSPEHVIEQGSKYILSKTLDGRSDNMVSIVVLEKKEHDLWMIITVMIKVQKK